MVKSNGLRLELSFSPHSAMCVTHRGRLTPLGFSYLSCKMRIIKCLPRGSVGRTNEIKHINIKSYDRCLDGSILFVYVRPPSP